MNRILTIKDEITNDPLSIGYSSMADQQVTNSLNTQNVSAKQNISTKEIQKYLAIVNKLIPLEAATTANAIKANRMMELFDSFTMSSPSEEAALTSMLDSLIEDSLISADDKTYILSLGDKPISRGEQLGLGSIKVGEVMEARL